jgi:hypothetical protein
MQARIARLRTLILLGTLLVSATALAQTRPANPLQGMARFTGTVVRVDGKEFKLEGAGGTTATYQLADSAVVMTSRPGTLADLASGKFIGCTAVGKASALYATECHIFPDSMRGTGEGHYPMGPPDTTMTNGNVSQMTNGEVLTATGSASGVTLKVSYKGGTQQIGVSSLTHIAVIRTGDASLLKRGAKVMGAAKTAPDGTELVQFLNITP